MNFSIALLCALASALTSCPGQEGAGTLDGTQASEAASTGLALAADGGDTGGEPEPLAPKAASGMRGAVDLFEQGRFAEAAVEFELLEGKVELLEQWRLYYLAESLFFAGKPAEALPVYGALGKHGQGQMAALAPYRAAECMLESGDAQGAASAFAAMSGKAVPQSVDSASVQAQWARSLEMTGHPEAARKRWELVATGFPHRPQGTQAIEALERLIPGFALTQGERIERALKLFDLKLWAQAEQELEGVGKGLEPARAREVALLRANCAYNKRNDWDRARELFEKLQQGKDDIAAEASYMKARCLHRSGQTAKAAQAYRSFLKRFPASSLRADALEQLIVIDWEAGRWKKVHSQGLPLLRSGAFSGDDRASVLWMVAFACYLEGLNDEAGKLLEEYSAQATESMSRARALYWSGVVEKARGDEDSAKRSWEKVARRYPLHYYALLATRRLLDAGLTPPDPAQILGVPPEQKDPAGQATATGGQCDGVPPVVMALLDAGLGWDARQEMKRLHPKLYKSAEKDPEKLIRIYSCVGAQKLLIAHASGSEDEQESGGALARWRLVYPTPWRAQVRKHAQAAGVPELLALSIVRQESMFDQDASSSVLAGGLMQLMPLTAERVAADLGEAWSADAVFDPETNVRWGTHYLGGLIRRFPDNLPSAIGAYNGGPGAMSRWLEQWAPVPGDVFVELIPYAQTRNYVRRVMTTWARYTYLETGEWKPALEWVPRTVTPKLGPGPEY